MNTRFFRRAAVVAIVLFTVSCGGGGSVAGVGGTGNPESQPELFRVVNAAPHADEITLTLGEAPLREVVAYGDSSNYVDVPEGMNAVRVRKEDEVVPTISGDLTIEAGVSSTYLVTETEDQVIEATVLTDTLVPPKGGLFSVRFINAGTNDPTDFYVTLPGDDSDDTMPVAAAVAFKGASEYVNIDPGTYRVHVTEMDVDRDLVESDSIEFDEAGIYTVIFLEKDGGGRPFQFLVLRDQ